VDHGFETKIDLLGADDLGNVLNSELNGMSRDRKSYAWVVGLENSDFDALVLEVALTLSEVEWCVVRRGVP